MAPAADCRRRWLARRPGSPAVGSAVLCARAVSLVEQAYQSDWASLRFRNSQAAAIPLTQPRPSAANSRAATAWETLLRCAGTSASASLPASEPCCSGRALQVTAKLDDAPWPAAARRHLASQSHVASLLHGLPAPLRIQAISPRTSTAACPPTRHSPRPARHRATLAASLHAPHIAHSRQPSPSVALAAGCLAAVCRLPSAVRRSARRTAHRVAWPRPLPLRELASRWTRSIPRPSGSPQPTHGTLPAASTCRDPSLPAPCAWPLIQPDTHWPLARRAHQASLRSVAFAPRHVLRASSSQYVKWWHWERHHGPVRHH